MNVFALYTRDLTPRPDTETHTLHARPLFHRYEAFGAESIEDIVLSQFNARALPLDVLQMDVDWHVRNTKPNHPKPVDPRCIGFNGYDWNRTLFPDPSAFVSTVHSGNWSRGGPRRALKLLLNTHSFEGVDPCCEEFAAIARELNHTDLSSRVTWNMSDRQTMGVVYGAVLAFNASAPAVRGSRPDYWWTDGALDKWNGIPSRYDRIRGNRTNGTNGADVGEGVLIDGVDGVEKGDTGEGDEKGGMVESAGRRPASYTGGLLSNAGNLMWNVHLHDGWIRGASPRGHGNRPMVMPRYGGVGQHRYCCGFSGDAASDFTTLQVGAMFQCITIHDSVWKVA